MVKAVHKYGCIDMEMFCSNSSCMSVEHGGRAWCHVPATPLYTCAATWHECLNRGHVLAECKDRQLAWCLYFLVAALVICYDDWRTALLSSHPSSQTSGDPSLKSLNDAKGQYCYKLFPVFYFGFWTRDKSVLLVKLCFTHHGDWKIFLRSLTNAVSKLSISCFCGLCCTNVEFWIYCTIQHLGNISSPYGHGDGLHTLPGEITEVRASRCPVTLVASALYQDH